MPKAKRDQSAALRQTIFGSPRRCMHLPPFTCCTLFKTAKTHIHSKTRASGRECHHCTSPLPLGTTLGLSSLVVPFESILNKVHPLLHPLHQLFLWIFFATGCHCKNTHSRTSKYEAPKLPPSTPAVRHGQMKTMLETAT